jgi:flavin-dependent dehydrogenase
MEENSTYDVAIIGAGPAGSMLARLLQDKRYRVALFDARPLDRDYKTGDKLKSCGGLIAPDAQKFLNKMGLVIPKSIIDKDQSKYVITTDFDINISRNFKRNYININREAFDRFLLKGLKADTYFGKLIKTIKQEKDFFIINNEVKAKQIVGADGALSFVRRKFFPNAKFRQYASVQELFEGKHVKGYTCYFDNSVSDYYGWALNKGNYTYVGYAIPEGQNAKKIFMNFKHKLKLGESKHQEGTVIIRPKFFHPITCSDNIFLIGEAGGYISPSSAEGISYAFRTAQILADSRLNRKNFKSKMLRIQLDIMYKSLKSVFMYTPWIRHLIMRLAIWK